MQLVYGGWKRRRAGALVKISKLYLYPVPWIYEVWSFMFMRTHWTLTFKVKINFQIPFNKINFKVEFINISS